MDKASRLLELARTRQKSRWPGYKPLAEYHQGAYECDFVSPWTKAAGNVDARIMVLLQDWSSHDRLSGAFDRHAAEIGHTPTFPTNRNLIRLLKTYFQLDLAEIYGTNLFPFIKPGKSDRKIPPKDLERAAREFALPQIKIVEPELVICLGLATFNGLRRALNGKDLEPIENAIKSPMSFGLSRIWCQAHTGSWGKNNRNDGGVDRVSRDWEAMRLALNT